MISISAQTSIRDVEIGDTACKKPDCWHRNHGRVWKLPVESIWVFWWYCERRHCRTQIGENLLAAEQGYGKRRVDPSEEQHHCAGSEPMSSSFALSSSSQPSSKRSSKQTNHSSERLFSFIFIFIFICLLFIIIAHSLLHYPLNASVGSSSLPPPFIHSPLPFSSPSQA